MKLANYFTGFLAFALAYWVFDFILSSPDTEVTSYIVCCLIFSVLATAAVYNLVQGYKLHKSEY